MPIDRYAMWCATATRVTADTHADDPQSPHINLFYEDRASRELSASINVKSKSAISELALYKSENFVHPIVDMLKDHETGIHRIDSRPGGLALDYIRGNLLDLSDGILLPHDIPGRENDLLDLIMPVLQRAAEKRSKIFLFGEPYNDDRGIHAVHMNQGSAGSFSRANGIWQDGGLIVEDADTNRHIAIFLAFGSQAVHTDETRGNALSGSQLVAELLGGARPPSGPGVQPSIPPRPQDPDLIPDDIRVAIVAALVNPEGRENRPDHDGRPELVYLMNRTSAGLSLKDWQLLNRTDEPHRISVDIWVPPGEVRAVTTGSMPLSNQGGTISLLDERGMKVDGVGYTRRQAREAGKVIVFRK